MTTTETAKVRAPHANESECWHTGEARKACAAKRPSGLWYDAFTGDYVEEVDG